jgi:hypothetical protein
MMEEAAAAPLTRPRLPASSGQIEGASDVALQPALLRPRPPPPPLSELEIVNRITL